MTIKLALLTVTFIYGSIGSIAQDTLPPLHTIKEKDIKLISPSFEDQTITVILENEAIYIYHRLDWDYEDYYPSTSKKIKEAIKNIKMTFTKVEHDAEFPGGQEAWDKCIHEFCAKHAGQIGSDGPAEITVQFIVHMKGQLTDISVIANRGGSSLADMAVQAIKESPPWKPAIQNGRNVIAYKAQVVKISVD